MSTTINKTIFSLLLVINMPSTLNSDAQQPLTPASFGYAPVNGSKVYYEMYGAGDPIVLLHGAYMTINSNWSELIPFFPKQEKLLHWNWTVMDIHRYLNVHTVIKHLPAM